MVRDRAGVARTRAPIFMRCFTLALLLGTSACSKQPAPDNSASAPDNNAAQEAARLAAEQANQQCIVTALNDTIYRQQSDDALVTALSTEKLDGCTEDFTQAFVDLRQGVQAYVPLARQVAEHARSSDSAVGADGVNLLCSLVRGEQCAPSFTVAWAAADDDLRQRATDAKTRMDTAKDAVEHVAAGYNVYAHTDPAPDAAAPDASAGGSDQPPTTTDTSGNAI